MTSLKEQILEECNRIVKEKESQLLKELDDITVARDIETKSTAGDKHETARAHMQSRQEQLSVQLTEINQRLVELSRIHLKPAGGGVFPGSLVETSQGYFFIAIAIGKIKANGYDIFVVSPQSPVGQLLTGLETHAEFTLNGKMYRILNIY